MKYLTLLFSLWLTGVASAQLDVRLEFKRRTYMRGEPIEAKVSIRNLSGHDVTLSDEGINQWFGFEVIRGSDTPVGPVDPNYENQPVTILNGESVTRSVDILQLYPVDEYGAYKVRAAIYFHETKKYLSSDQTIIEISDGRKMWSQTVGVPSGTEGEGKLRQFSLLSFQTPKDLQLYCRVVDEETGTILATYPIGRILTGAKPMVEFDDNNTLYSFHMTGPSLYALSKIGVNGEWLGQALYNSPKGRATVRKKPGGTMVVVGATRDRTKDAAAAGGPPVPKLSDAPPVAVPVPRQ
jgi:hypothetical protein